jgi:hypothetical protein
MPDLPSSLTPDDTSEVNRLLGLVFKGDAAASSKWLTERSGYFNCPPIELLKRDEIGVVRVIDYLKDASPPC